MVEIKNITFAYNRNVKNVLEDVAFDIERGQCVAILGNNGAGKSTLLKCIDHICPVDGGVVLVDGQNLFSMDKTTMAQNVAYVPQNSPFIDMMVFDAILLGRKPYITWDATSEDREIVLDIMQKMGLSDFALRRVSELSGGEAQKVVLARALAQNPKLLLLDEPTNNLDPRNQHEVLLIVKKIAREHNIAVAIVIHDLNLAVRYCDRFVFLKDSRVYASGGREIMTPENIEQVYQMRVHIVEHMGIPVVVPLTDEHLKSSAAESQLEQMSLA